MGNTSRMSGYPCTSFRWKPLTPSDYVACNCDGTIKWYSCANETAYGHYEKEDRAYLCGDYQSKEEWCVFGTDSNTIEVFDNETMKPLLVILYLFRSIKLADRVNSHLIIILIGSLV